MRLYTIAELNSLRKTKKELFAQLADSFDYAVPQDWLDAFASWCQENRPEVTYDLIRSATVWSYAHGNNHFGFPVTISQEVKDAYLAYTEGDTRS